MSAYEYDTNRFANNMRIFQHTHTHMYKLLIGRVCVYVRVSRRQSAVGLPKKRSLSRLITHAARGEAHTLHTDHETGYGIVYLWLSIYAGMLEEGGSAIKKLSNADIAVL